MTDRLYYHNSFLYDFVAALLERRSLPDGRTALVLDRTAFYPTSGGQVFDTGWIELEPLEGERPQFLPKVRVGEVVEEGDDILHVIDSDGEIADSPTRVRGFIDVDRRRDHMQQHSGQHVLSAAFVELFGMPTVSFHMGEEMCTIDLDAKGLTADQVRNAEQHANQVVWDDQPVSVEFVTEDEARALGVRKIPDAGHEKLRLINIKDVDLCACGGTHVRSTGQIGSILIRKVEKVKQGVRVEFVCGARAVRHARKDYETLTDAAALFSTHLWEVSAQVQKALEESKLAAKAQHKANEQIAELLAGRKLSETPETNGTKLVVEIITDGDLAFTKLLAQKLVALSPVCVALLAAASGQPALVFAQSPGLPHDMGALLKQAVTSAGGRGGGNRDMAQGGVPDASRLQELLERAAKSLRLTTSE